MTKGDYALIGGGEYHGLAATRVINSIVAESIVAEVTLARGDSMPEAKVILKEMSPMIKPFEVYKLPEKAMTGQERRRERRKKERREKR